jgi:hypothetical protein
MNEQVIKMVLQILLVVAIGMLPSFDLLARAEDSNVSQEQGKQRHNRKLNKIPVNPDYPGPDWRVQMSEVLIGKTQETDALWTYARQQLAETDPNVKPEEWTRYSIQRMSIGDTQFMLFAWVNLYVDHWGEPGHMPWLLVTKKNNKIIYRSFDNESTKYAAPIEFGMIPNTDFADSLQKRKDTSWEKTCRRPLASVIQEEGYDFYRDCAALWRVKSQDGDAVIFRTNRLTSGSFNHIWSFDAQSGELRSYVEVSGKFSDLDLHYHIPTKTLYLAGSGLDLQAFGRDAQITRRRSDAAKAFSLTRLGRFFSSCQFGVPGGCALGTFSYAYRRLALSTDAQFLDDPSLPTNTAYMESERKNMLTNGDESSMERRWGDSWKLRVIRVSHTMGYFAAFDTRQRIIDEWNRIPKFVRQDIDPSELALYWAAQGMESFLDAFPSPLLQSKSNIK